MSSRPIILSTDHPRYQVRGHHWHPTDEWRWTDRSGQGATLEIIRGIKNRSHKPDLWQWDS